MVEVDQLASLDGLIWLRTGSQVASKFNLNQSTVSRKSKKCAEIFGICLFRSESEWHLEGDLTLLRLERRVHQLARWHRRKLLRLEAQYWSGPFLCSPPPAEWITGNFNFFEYHRPAQLLRERIIDAWIASYPDVPDGDDPDLISLPLSKMPIMPIVRNGHPLTELGPRVTFQDVAKYPLLPIPDGAFPKFQQMLEECGVWSGRRLPLPDQNPYLENSAAAGDLMVGFSTPLTKSLYGDGHACLPLSMPLDVGDSLVVHRDHFGSPRFFKLAVFLNKRLQALAAEVDGLTVLDVSIDRLRQVTQKSRKS